MPQRLCVLAAAAAGARCRETTPGFGAPQHGAWRVRRERLGPLRVHCQQHCTQRVEPQQSTEADERVAHSRGLKLRRASGRPAVRRGEHRRVHPRCNVRHHRMYCRVAARASLRPRMYRRRVHVARHMWAWLLAVQRARRRRARRRGACTRHGQQLRHGGGARQQQLRSRRAQAARHAVHHLKAHAPGGARRRKPHQQAHVAAMFPAARVLVIPAISAAMLPATEVLVIPAAPAAMLAVIGVPSPGHPKVPTRRVAHQQRRA
mmetsp:Transcript_3163/g.8746  ORF Transcript_3163/g.8746 Transcript_3163/m.8746 type:complete len:262 (-) Transcript_3163:2148-2933(-)